MLHKSLQLSQISILWLERGSVNADQIKARMWLSKCSANVVACKNSLDQDMLESNLLDAIPCDVKAENISNCNKSRIYFRRRLH